MNSKATVFEFTNYEFTPAKKQAVFHYVTHLESGEVLSFSETITLPKVPELEGMQKEVLEKTLESLHLILGISYYKFYCAPEIKIPYTLTKKEAEFWNIVYKKGLGEFFFRNNLDPSISPKFPVAKVLGIVNSPRGTNGEFTIPKTTHARALVGIGGGKDSIVSAQLLKEHGFNVSAFLVNSGDYSAISEKIVDILSVPDIKIQRTLDPKVHQKHQYNGHIPISAIYAFLGVFSALLYDYKYVIVSNEHSSNFGNIKYKGLDINHQWSKSFEFESLFSDYVKNSLTPSITYFSLLRPLYEIRIVKLFAKYKQYFNYFSSCNANFKILGKPPFAQGSGGAREHEDIWCGQCAKCVFAFILLSAFLSKKELVNIFKKNLYTDESLLPLFKDVLGFGTIKPFDCVGTFEEAQTALSMAKNPTSLKLRRGRESFKGDYIMRQLGKKARYHQEVFKTAKENLVPDQFKLLGMESALIVGFGKEGKVTKKYLKKYFPTLKIGIADAKQGSDYLAKQANFDIAIKSPGIKKELITIPYTTATNLFFSHVKGKNMIIGVTGSKGKSTTSSLIYHILKTAGKNVELLGNIGKPMLEYVLNTSAEDKSPRGINGDLSSAFVLELSSFQLDDIHYSPDIAVVTNLFPEHMDFHGSLKNYYGAKKNIINYQTTQDYFVYNQKTHHWLKDYPGKPFAFSDKKYASQLLGQHNESNIGAAAAVAQILQIPEEIIAEAIKTFKGLEHRLELVGEFKGIQFYDDAISTTPDSTIMAIRAIKNIGTIFLGGTDRGYDFSELEKVIRKYKIKNIVLFPDTGKRILKDTLGLNILSTKSMKEAVRFAYTHTPRGMACVLSCASPSFSLWKNFEAKGDEFKKFVKQLGK